MFKVENRNSNISKSALKWGRIELKLPKIHFSRINFHAESESDVKNYQFASENGQIGKNGRFSKSDFRLFSENIVAATVKQR